MNELTIISKLTKKLKRKNSSVDPRLLICVECGSYQVIIKEISNLANEIFRVDPKILHLGLIDLEGHVLLDQSTSTPEPIEPGQDRC